MNHDALPEPEIAPPATPATSLDPATEAEAAALADEFDAAVARATRTSPRAALLPYSTACGRRRSPRQRRSTLCLPVPQQRRTRHLRLEGKSTMRGPD